MSYQGAILFASGILSHYLWKPSNTIVLGKRQSSFELLLILAQNKLRDLGIPHMGFRFHKLSQKTTVVQYGKTQSHYLEVFQPNDSPIVRDRSKPSKVLMFVHGGGWGSGKPWMYRLIAEGLGKLIDVDLVVNVGYPVYPRASMLQQALSMKEAVEYLRKNGSKISVEPSDTIILSGHSSGVHVIALYLISTLQYALINPVVANSIVWPDVFLGLAGIYDIGKHYLHEAMRGVHQLSPMKGAAGGELQFDNVSPTLLVQQMTIGNSGEHQSVLQRFPKVALLHGEQDTVVPFTTTVEFAGALKTLLAGEQALFCSIIDTDHGSIVTDLMFENRTIPLVAIQEMCKKCLQ